MVRTTPEFRQLYRDLQDELKRRAEQVSEQAHERELNRAVARTREYFHFHRSPAPRPSFPDYSKPKPEPVLQPKEGKKQRVLRPSEWPAEAHPPGGPPPRGQFEWDQRFECRREAQTLSEGYAARPQNFNEKQFEYEMKRPWRRV